MQLAGDEINNTNLSLEQKEAASFLRERFLYLIASLPGKCCKLGMYNKTDASAQIRAFDLSFENVLVENLKSTNSSLISKALLRTSDLKTISYTDIM